MAESKRRYAPAKIEVQALALAKKAAAMADKTVADYVSDLVLAHVERYVPAAEPSSPLRPQQPARR